VDLICVKNVGHGEHFKQQDLDGCILRAAFQRARPESRYCRHVRGFRTSHNNPFCPTKISLDKIVAGGQEEADIGGVISFILPDRGITGK
jgi:hypothetical protein